MNIIQDIFKLISKRIDFQVGIITYVDLDKGVCTVRVNKTTELQCQLFYNNANSYADTKTVWGNIKHFSKGDFVFVLLLNNQPYILENITGFKKPQEIYTNGKLTINRIADADDTDTTPDPKLKIGELILRSLGLGDLFFDKFGNVILDSEKEFFIRIGDRNASHIIDAPETTLRFGRVKDATGNDTDYSMVIENENVIIRITKAGVIELGDGATEKLVLGSSFLTFFNQHIHPTPMGPSSPPVNPMVDATHLSQTTKTI